MNDLQIEAFLICDSVVQDGSTGKYVITGVFDNIWPEKLPAVYGSLTAYFRLRVVSEKKEFKLSIALSPPSRLREQMPDLPVASDANGKIEGSVMVVGLPLREEGRHEVQLCVNGDVVAVYPFEVRVRGGAPHGIH